MPDASALPDPDYTELIGIGLGHLDALSAASQQANAGLIGLSDWRAVRSDVLAAHPGVQILLDQHLESWLDRSTRIWFGDETALTPAWSAMSAEEREPHLQRLVAHLAGLQAPPDDADLPRLRTDIDDQLRAAQAAGRPELVDLYVERKQQLARWIVETGAASAPSIGVPAQRWVEDDVLGGLPADAVRVPAEGLSDPQAVVDYLRWLNASQDPSAQAVMHEWHRGNLPFLLEEFLDQRA